MRAVIASLMLLGSLGLVVAKPLQADDPVPALKIDAVNDGPRATYDVAKDAGANPLVVLFINLRDVEDPDNRWLVAELEKSYRQLKDQYPLKVAIVVVGATSFTDDLAAACNQLQITVPTAMMAPEDEQLAAWGWDKEPVNLVVFARAGKVVGAVTDAGQADEAELTQLAEAVMTPAEQ